MTSERELRAEIERLNRHIDGREECWMHAFDDGYTLAAELIASPRPGPDFAPWAYHLARVADAAKAEGYREGYGQACEAAHATAALSAIHPQPEPEATPDPAEPAGGELQRFSADCGFFCHCCGPRPDVWQPGSVTR